MKRIGLTLIATFLLLCILFNPAWCVPLDLSGFTGDATESGGTITFVDDFSKQWYAYYNPNFTVEGDAGILSFDYTLDLMPDGVNDYLALEINYSQVLTVTSEGADNLSFDMSAFQGQTIDLAWVLWWGGDFNAAGSMATVGNIDLATASSNPVPEPATLMLLCSGLCALPLMKRRKKQ